VRTIDQQLHFLGGFAKASWRRCFTAKFSTTIIHEIDVWAFDREWAQNLKGKNPNYPMSAHQLAEARAWGKGARFALGLDEPYPSPPYPS